MMVSRELLEFVRHELVCCDGLYCSDSDDLDVCWRLDLSEVISELDCLLG